VDLLLGGDNMWQDYIFSIGNFAFAAMLIPSLISDKKPHWFTSLFTSLLLYLFSYCFLTLKLNLTFIALLISASCWMSLFIQSAISMCTGRIK